MVLNGRRSAAEITEIAKLAEQNGISHLWLSAGSRAKDHFLRLAGAADVTKRISLGPVAISPFEMHPARIGISILTLHEVSHGRACIALGGGGDFAATLNVPMKHRAEAVGETVDIIQALARGGEVNYPGNLYRVNGLFSPWTKMSAPPLYLAANRPKMLGVAAEKGDGVMFSDAPPRLVGSLIELVQTELLRRKRDKTGFRFNNWFVWNVQETAEEARRVAERHLGFRLYYIRDVAPFLGLDPETVKRLEEMQPGMIRAIFKGQEPETPPRRVSELLVDHLTITGSIKELDVCIEKLREFERKGLNEIALALEGNPVATIKLLGERVVPELAAETVKSA